MAFVKLTYQLEGANIVELPTAFIEKYQRLLGDEAADFLAALQAPSQAGFRSNPLKPTLPTATIAQAKGKIAAVPTGYYGQVDGHSLDHVTGWVYSQEPSAMLVGEVVAPQAGEKVLDLCAAPGGKSTHLIGKMQDQGLLVANEIFPKRAKILAENLERWGANQAVVTSESPDHLAPQFPQFFDRILVDAPCSGEGMFRKEPEGIQYWHPDYPLECANRQRKILKSALQMLKPGGTLVYSTCTFAPEEDEQVIAWLLDTYPELSLVEIPKQAGMDAGHPAWANGNPELTKTLRLFPHHYQGEGHFIAKLQLAGEPQVSKRVKQRKGQRPSLTKEQQQYWEEFRQTVLPAYQPERLVTVGDHLIAMPDLFPRDVKVKIVQGDVELGIFKKKRFEPSHALALACQQARQVEISFDDWHSYVHGDVITLTDPPTNGWYVVTCQGHHCGWGKVTGSNLKNFFPKGLRFGL
ncbi:tRNA rRNA methyltransferase [Limosilactobacillus gastricus DSM 16045]|uniref:tRNA rRNA methyltransferase n=1 Tax=Limosilactobacillus gastricus DSM 16045 TaxID=1423749 RepID=A0A0R1V5I8_9LACO|nr:tRNA rRNA methyltransferase [Limosilactobacillus gastricus DSM 16045]